MLSRIKSFSPSTRAVISAFVIALFALSVLLPNAAIAATTNSASYSYGYGCNGHYYKVRKGDSLSKIAYRYSVKIYSLAKANGLGTRDHVYIGQHLCIPAAKGYGHGKGHGKGHGHSGCSSYHYVRKGETLSHIAKYYGVNYYGLAKANHISNPNHIRKGQKICIVNVYGYGKPHKPQKPHYGYGKYYIVKKGDSLSKIAYYHGISTRKLAHANHIYNVHHIYVGQKLRIPH